MSCGEEGEKGTLQEIFLVQCLRLPGGEAGNGEAGKGAGKI